MSEPSSSTSPDPTWRRPTSSDGSPWLLNFNQVAGQVTQALRTLQSRGLITSAGVSMLGTLETVAYLVNVSIEHVAEGTPWIISPTTESYASINTESARAVFSGALQNVEDHVRHGVNDDAVLFNLAEEMCAQVIEVARPLLQVIGQAITTRSLQPDEDDLDFETGAYIDWYGRQRTVTEALRNATAEQSVIAAARTRLIVKEAEQSRDEAQEARDAARLAAGETSDLVLSAGYKTLADRERRAANWFLASAVGVTLIVTGYAVLVSFKYAPGTSELVQRMGAGVPALLLAGLLARESARRRRVAHWARTLELQLDTLDAFVQPLHTTEAVTELRLLMGRTIYGDRAGPDLRGGDPRVLGADDLLDLVERVARLQQGANSVPVRSPT